MKKTTYQNVCLSVQRIALKHKCLNTEIKVNPLDNEIVRVIKDYDNDIRVIKTYFSDKLNSVNILYKEYSSGAFQIFGDWFRL